MVSKRRVHISAEKKETIDTAKEENDKRIEMSGFQVSMDLELN